MRLLPFACPPPSRIAILAALFAATSSFNLFAQAALPPVQSPVPHMPRAHSQARRADTSTQQVDTPQFSVAPGSYSDPQTVTITDSTPGATIYYSTNGTYPWPSAQTQYNGPITVSASEIVVAVATATGYQNSEWGIAEYLITSVPSRFTYTVAGNLTWGYSGDGGPAPAARFSNPNAAVADSAGNVYIADSGNNVIRKVDAKTGIITTIAGNGQAANSGDGGPAISAALWTPQYLALDGSGHLYIGELGDVVVRRVNLATGQITAFAGDPNGTVSTGPATSVKLGGLIGLALDTSDNLYIGTGASVLKIDIATNSATQYAGYGPTPGYDYMTSFAMDTLGNVYGWEGGYGMVEKITPGGQVTVVAGKNTGIYPPNGGDGGPATNAYLGPNGYIAVDQAGNLYISDSWNGAIREVTAKDGIINTIAGVFANSSIGGDGDPSTSSDLYFPGNLSLDASGNIYLAWPAEERILKITAPATPPTTPAAAPSFSLTPGSYPNTQQLEITSTTPDASIYLSFDGSDPSTAGQAYHGPIQVTGSVAIKAIAVAPGTLKSSIADASYTITDPPQAVISTFAGTGKYGFPTAGGVANKTRIGQATSIAFAANGTAYIIDSNNNAVWKVDSTGTLSLVAGNGTYGFSGDGDPAASAVFNFPQGVAVDASGNVYIADAGNNRIRKIDAATGIINTVAGGGAQSSTCGDGGPAKQAWVSRPSALAFDSSGNIYIADTGDGRIRFVDASTGIITTVAGSSTMFPVQDGVPATQQDMSPVAIALDKQNNLYIADDWNGRIRKVDTSTNIITTLAGGGLTWPAENGSLATGVIILPRGVAVASDGAVYFSDFSAVVRKVDPATGLLSITAGNTYYGYSGDGGAATMASLYAPRQLTFDASGNLFIPDIGADAVREVTFSTPAAVPQISVPAGTYTSAQHITLNDSTSGATIYYTLDGSTPDTASTVYSAPIVLRNSATLQAVAAAPGHPLSTVAHAAYIITLQTPTIALSSSASAAFVSNPVTFTASLAGASATPSGSVTFLDGATTLGTATLNAGTATYTTSSLTAGPHTITVSYDGDDNFNSATSLTLTQTIQDFTMGAPGSGSTSATVQPGGTATYTVSVMPPSGSTTPADITFSITGLPAGATATFNPAKVPAGSAATSVSLSIAVPAQSSAALRPASQRFPLEWGLLILPLLRLRRNRRALARTLLLAALAFAGAVVIATLSGCGGSGSQSVTPKPQPQTYNLTVTATAGTLTHTTNLTLTVD